MAEKISELNVAKPLTIKSAPSLSYQNQSKAAIIIKLVLNWLSLKKNVIN